MFESSGVQRGDKIALYGRNSSNWAVNSWRIGTATAP
jgi:long-subunit acyl-CoA synthetase (AMP-forming)